MKQAIQKAIEGGYLKQNGASSISVEFHKDATYTVEYADGSSCHFNFNIESSSAYKLIDPLFWQALGRAMGWDGKPFAMEVPHHGTPRIYKTEDEWKNHWHRFIDHLASGGTADDFFTDLLKSN